MPRADSGAVLRAAPATAVYLDHHATTPVHPSVFEAMRPYFTLEFGNASSREHAFGWRAEAAVDLARERVAALIEATPEEIVFTSGATEADNLAILGMFHGLGSGPRHFVTQATEHHAVLDACRHLARLGAEIAVLPVDREGFVSPDAVAEAIRPDTRLVSIMAANNEIGTLQPVAEIGAICRARGVLFHVDAAQAAGILPVRVDEIGADLMVLSAHKMGGPKGVGALYIRRRSPPLLPAPMLHGGGHERGLRSGTLNVPGIVGMGAACERAQKVLIDRAKHVQALRDRLRAGLLRIFPDAIQNGPADDARRHPGNLHLSFPGVRAADLLASMARAGIAASSGAACTSATPEPSHVLQAIGLPPHLIQSSVRFGVGEANTQAEIDYVIARMAEILSSIKR